MNILEQVEKILKSKNESDKKDKLLSISLIDLELNDYKNYIKKLFIELPYDNSIDLFLLFMERVSNEFGNNKILEQAYYDLLIYILKGEFKTKFMFAYIPVLHKYVSFLSQQISKEKLNHYNEYEKTSILKETLISRENILCLDVLLKNGLEPTSVEGLNPYYYVLHNSNYDINNDILSKLHELNIPLPENYWSYVFYGITENKINFQNDYLLTLKDKKFILNDHNEESVWHVIIKNNTYGMIDYIPNEFYKPYKLKNKDIIDYLIDMGHIGIHNLIFHLKGKIFLLIEKNDDLLKYWQYYFNNITIKYINHEIIETCIKIIKNSDNQELKCEIEKLEQKKQEQAIEISTLAEKSDFELSLQLYIETLDVTSRNNLLLLIEQYIFRDTKDTDKDSVNIETKPLYTQESLDKFLNEHKDSTNDTLLSYVKKLGKNNNSQSLKTVSLASNLFNNLEKLYETFPHFEEVIKHIENIMVLQNKGDKTFYIPPLLLGGGPGVGKTFFCNTISKLVETTFEVISMESVSANMVLTGNSAQWGGAEPGRIFKSLMSEDKKTINPIILLDELEKAGGDSRYNPTNCLLPLLERYTAKKFKDECIPLEIDASYITWFATVNNIDMLTAPIKSRFDIFSIPNPNPNQKKSLIKGIYKSVKENNTWGHFFDDILPEDTLDVLANLMSDGAARDIRKSIIIGCSKAVRKDQKILLPEHIERYKQNEIMPWDLPVL